MIHHVDPELAELLKQAQRDPDALAPLAARSAQL
jgi:hypothetical protein